MRKARLGQRTTTMRKPPLIWWVFFLGGGVVLTKKGDCPIFQTENHPPNQVTAKIFTNPFSERVPQEQWIY